MEAVFEPVQPPTTLEETVERLGIAIRLGILAAGARLPPERELAEQLGISRSTLRQAITTLVQSGHLLSLRGRRGGTFVAAEPPLASGPDGPLRADWREVLGLRQAIESGAVLLAAERAEEETLALMRECVARMDRRPGFEVYRRADIRFHIALAQASGVPRLVALMTEVQAEIAELVAHIPRPGEVLTNANHEHAALLEALAARDSSAALRILRTHLAATERALERLMAGGL